MRERLAIPQPLQQAWTRTATFRSVSFFGGGVLLDYATLQLEDVVDQLLLVLYLLSFLLVVAVSHRHERKRWLPSLVERGAWMLPYANQFILGALLSALAIAVFRALHPGPAALFFSGLFALAIANETRSEATRGTVSRFALVGFLSYQVLAILVPLLTGRLWGPLPALFGTLALLAACTGLAFVHVPGREPPPSTVEQVESLWVPSVSGLGAVFLLLICTWLGLVPPLPLAMKRAAVAEDVVRGPDGPELVAPRWTDSPIRLLLGRPTLDWAPGDSIAVYTAVHAPAGMELDLIHAWERYGEDGWTQTDAIDLTVRGGRTGGWRTWSQKRHLQSGDWRVRVLSPYGQELGRVPFRVNTEAR